MGNVLRYSGLIVIVAVGCAASHWGNNKMAASVKDPPTPVWPMVGGGGARIFHGAAIGLSVAPAEAWRRKPFGGGYFDVAVANEEVVIALGSPPDDVNKPPTSQPLWVLTALRLRDGQELWRHHSRDMGWVFARQIVLGKERLFVACQTGLMALDCRTGRIVWHRKSALCNCLVADERHLYVSGVNGQVKAFRRSDGRAIWKSRPDLKADSLALRGDRLVASAYDPPGAVALSVEDGHVLWRTTVPPVVTLFGRRPVRSARSLAICGESVLATAIAGKPSWDTARDYGHSYLAALSLDTGKLRWKRRPPPAAGVGVASDGSRRVYVPRESYRGSVLLGNQRWSCEVLCLDLRTGRKLWRKRLPQRRALKPGAEDPLIVPVVVSGRTVLAGKTDGELFGLSAETGKVLWYMSFTGEFGILEHVLIAGGHVILLRGSEVIALKPKVRAEAVPSVVEGR